MCILNPRRLGTRNLEPDRILITTILDTGTTATRINTNSTSSSVDRIAAGAAMNVTSASLTGTRTAAAP